MNLPNAPYIFLLDLDNTFIDAEKIKSAIFLGLAGFLNKRVSEDNKKKTRESWLRSISDLYEETRKNKRMISLGELSAQISLQFQLPQQEILQAIRKIDPSKFIFF